MIKPKGVTLICVLQVAKTRKKCERKEQIVVIRIKEEETYQIFCYAKPFIIEGSRRNTRNVFRHGLPDLFDPILSFHSRALPPHGRLLSPPR
jgi:hypothetical protein